MTDQIPGPFLGFREEEEETRTGDDDAVAGGLDGLELREVVRHRHRARPSPHAASAPSPTAPCGVPLVPPPPPVRGSPERGGARGGGGGEIARCGVEEFGGDETKAVAVKRVGVNGSERLTCGAHVSVSHGRLQMSGDICWPC